MTGDQTDRYRLVVLGPSKAGKTCLLKRYLEKSFPDRYRETVEDIYTRDFHIHGCTLPLSFYDTNFNYPDMRRILISHANAFLLMFAVNDVSSFKEVSNRFINKCFSERTFWRLHFSDKLFPPSIYCQLITICYFQVTELMQEVFQRRSDAVSLPLVLVGAKNDADVVKKVSRLLIILWQFSLKNFMMRGLVYDHTNFFLSLSEYQLRESVAK